MDKRSLLITTEHDNHYLVSTAVSQIILLHPVLKEIIALQQDGDNFSRLLQQAEQKNDAAILPITRALFNSIEEVKYYYFYYLFLKENNYFDEYSIHELNDSMYSPVDIQNYVAGSPQLSFEVTDECNLDCTYCCYGALYEGYDDRGGKHMTLDAAVQMIDYWLEKRKNTLNASVGERIFIGFYGGEPLINFTLIEEVVRYIKKRVARSTEVGFSMTTNGTLMEKYIDFLVENNFQLMISLDGDFEQNKYRVFKNGGYTFEIVCRNIDLIRKKYPTYYRKNVEFNTVLHSRNNRRKVMDFFQNRFNKTPHVASLSSLDVREEKRERFEIIRRVQTDKNNIDVVTTSPLRKIGNSKPMVTDVFNARGMVFAHTGYIVRKYAQLLENIPRSVIVSTGTCAPFSKKIFITVNGKILPCERVSQYFSMGTVDETGVSLDYNDVATKYNEWYKRIEKICNNCYDSHYCGKCIFFLNLRDDSVFCDRFKSKEDYKRKLASIVSKIETFPETYLQVFNAESHGDEKEQNSILNVDSTGKSCGYLYLHPYVHLNVKKDLAVIYNTLNYYLFEFSRHKQPEVFAVLEQLNLSNNLYVSNLEENASSVLKGFVQLLRRSLSGDFIPPRLSKGKPIQFKPMLKLEAPPVGEENSIAESKLKTLVGDKIEEYLDTLNLYLNETCEIGCEFCSNAYRQFYCCRSKEPGQNESSIPVTHVTALINQLKNTSLLNLNILGGNILLYNELEIITARLNEVSFRKNWYIHWRTLAQIDIDSIPAGLNKKGNSFHLICPAPIEKKSIDELLNRLIQNGFPVFLHFLITGKEDFAAAESLINELKPENVQMHPLFLNGGENIDFFKENVFVDRDYINKSTLIMQDVFARSTLNTLNFRQLTMMSNGDVYANVNHHPLGKFPVNNLTDLIKKELGQGTSWGCIRKDVIPCKFCSYNALCPPISNYDFVLNRFDLCTIWRNQKIKKGQANFSSHKKKY